MEYRLAKARVAGSNPVSRSQEQKRISVLGYPLLFFESNPGLEVRMSPLRSGPRKAEVHRTSYAVSRSQEQKRISVLGYPLLFFESNPGLEVRMSPLCSGPCRTEVHWTSCFSALLRSVQNRGPLDLVHRLAVTKSLDFKGFFVALICAP